MIQASPLSFFSQDTFVLEDSRNPITFELFGINEATSSFQLRASGTLRNSLVEEEFNYIPENWFWVRVHYPGGSLLNVTSEVVNWSIPDGPGFYPDGDGGCTNPAIIGASVSDPFMCAGYPTLLDPLDWSATFKITVPELAGSNYVLDTWAGEAGVLFGPNGSILDSWGNVAGETFFDFSIVPTPEPSSAMMLAAGVLGIVALVRRRSLH